MVGSPLVVVETATVVYGTDRILDAVSLGVATGERIGVVGRNGGGKTTLARLLVGAEQPDSGRVVHTGGLRVGYLPQSESFAPGHTVSDVVLGDAAEHEWATDAQVRATLAALAIPPLDRDVGSLSGGERRRVALARVLVAHHDLLVLDEPTNHLDLEAIDALGGLLAARKESVVVVTHDRWFLDSVCTSTWEVADAAVHRYDGGYSAFVLARAERARIASGVEDRRRQLVRKELAWLRRGPPARTSKPKFRMDAAAALIADEPPPRDTVSLHRIGTARLGRKVLDVEDVTVSRGGRTLLDHVTWQLGPGDRVGIVGVNGSGKTTLLRLLAAETEPDTGRVVRGTTVRTAHLDQEVRSLPENLRVLEAVEEVALRVEIAGGRSLTAAQLLERFGVAAGRQWTPVAELSGGERRRVQLLRLLMAEPNVLLLDEPTNDLDLETLNSLEDLLDEWPGSVCLVSHDRWFLERTCDVVLALLGDGSLAQLPGGVEDYLARRRALVATTTATGRPAARGSATSRDTRAARKELVRLERTLERLTREEKGLHAELAAQATDHAAVAVLDARLRALTIERNQLEDAWLEAAQAAE